MNFRAKLRRSSSIHRQWIGASRVGGTISGVQFRKMGTLDFVSVDDPLPPDAVSALAGHHMVDLEVSSLPTGTVEVVESDEEGDDSGEGEDGDDPLAALWRNKEPKQEPVTRRRGRPPTNR